MSGKFDEVAEKIGMLLCLADEIDQDTLNDLIRISDSPMAKAMMPLVVEQLKAETGLGDIPFTELVGTLKLLAFFLSELKKLGFGETLVKEIREKLKEKEAK